MTLSFCGLEVRTGKEGRGRMLGTLGGSRRDHTKVKGESMAEIGMNCSRSSEFRLRDRSKGGWGFEGGAW